MTIDNQHTQYAYIPPTPTQAPWQPKFESTQLQCTDLVSLKDMAAHFQSQFDEIDKQREIELKQEEWSYQSYLHEKELEDQIRQFEENLAKELAIKNEQMKIFLAQV